MCLWLAAGLGPIQRYLSAHVGGHESVGRQIHRRRNRERPIRQTIYNASDSGRCVLCRLATTREKFQTFISQHASTAVCRAHLRETFSFRRYRAAWKLARLVDDHVVPEQRVLVPSVAVTDGSAG